MTQSQFRIQFQRIFHPSDFSGSSFVAFAHALKLTVANKCSLTILHADPGPVADQLSNFPRVRRTLENWNLLPPDSAPEVITGLGLDIEKVVLPDSDSTSSIVRYLHKHPHDLIVLSTHQHGGLERWVHQPVAEPVARESAEMTLFIPHGVRGIVSTQDGSVRLRNILIPFDRTPNPQVAFDAAHAFTEALGCRGVIATLLHVGELGLLPESAHTSTGSLHSRLVYVRGAVEQEILKAAAETQADLIVMATEGHHGFLDALRGSTTERIVRHAKCPVLAVPTYRAAEAVPSTLESLATGKLNI